jgi:chaperonin GroES
MSVKPLYDRVLLKRNEPKEEIRGGIYIPDSAKEKPLEAEVVAVGPGKRGENGEYQPLTVNVGDRVLVGKYAGTEVKIDDVEHIVLREDEILAIFG